MKIVTVLFVFILGQNMAQATCSNFSGTWSVKCTLDGKPEEPYTEKWTQVGCEKLIFDDHHEHIIGGITSEESKTAEGIISHSTSYNWNADKTQILYFGTEIKKSFSSPQAKSSASHGTYTTDGQRLRIVVKYNQVLIHPTAQAETRERTHDCVYSK